MTDFPLLLCNPIHSSAGYKWFTFRYFLPDDHPLKDSVGNLKKEQYQGSPRDIFYFKSAADASDYKNIDPIWPIKSKVFWRWRREISSPGVSGIEYLSKSWHLEALIELGTQIPDEAAEPFPLIKLTYMGGTIYWVTFRHYLPEAHSLKNVNPKGIKPPSIKDIFFFKSKECAYNDNTFNQKIMGGMGSKYWWCKPISEIEEILQVFNHEGLEELLAQIPTKSVAMPLVECKSKDGAETRWFTFRHCLPQDHPLKEIVGSAKNYTPSPKDIFSFETKELAFDYNIPVDDPVFGGWMWSREYEHGQTNIDFLHQYGWDMGPLYVLLETVNIELEGKSHVKPVNMGLTSRVRDISELAVQFALLNNSPAIASEHLLLAIVEEGGGVAAKALAQLGVTKEELCQQLNNQLGL